VREIVLEHHHTRYPIYDGDLDHIIGMLHVKDLLGRIPRKHTHRRRFDQGDAGGA
jgi:CBS domain containing-hemolysin-like protein